MTGRARKETWAAQRTRGGSAPHSVSNDLSLPDAGPSNCKMSGDKSPCKANDLLATADADDRPRGASLPHGSAGQSSEHVVALAPWPRRQVDDVDPWEHEELQACSSHDAPEACGGLWTHEPSEAMQGTPLVVPDTHCPAMDNVGITATSRGSGIERTIQQEYCSVMSRDESLMPGPRATFPQAEQPKAKGNEQVVDKQPTSSTKRRFDKTWLERAMEHWKGWSASSRQ